MYIYFIVSPPFLLLLSGVWMLLLLVLANGRNTGRFSLDSDEHIAGSAGWPVTNRAYSETTQDAGGKQNRT